MAIWYHGAGGHAAKIRNPVQIRVIHDTPTYTCTVQYMRAEYKFEKKTSLDTEPVGRHLQ
jgi:hypothetical protein